MKFHDDIKRVALEDVRPNEYNPFSMDGKTMKKEMQSIKTDGFVGAIEVRQDPDDEKKYIIVDGEQRWTAAKNLGYTEIPILVTGKDDVGEAKVTTIKRNVLKGNLDTLKMASLISSLVDEHNYTIEDLADELGWADETVKRLQEMSDEDMEAINELNNEIDNIPKEPQTNIANQVVFITLSMSRETYDLNKSELDSLAHIDGVVYKIQG